MADKGIATTFSGDSNHFFMRTEKVYQVSGIISTWDEMFGFARLPLMIQATLIPFGDVIISDGLVQTYNIIIGGNMAKSFKETYMVAKKSGLIYHQL